MEQNSNSFYLTIFLYFLHFRLSPLLVDGAITIGKLFLKCDLTAIVAGVSIMSWASFAIVFPCSRSHYHNICHLFRSNWFCIFYFMYYFIICYLFYFIYKIFGFSKLSICIITIKRHYWYYFCF